MTSHKIEETLKTSYDMPIWAEIMLFSSNLPYSDYRHSGMQYSTLFLLKGFEELKPLKVKNKRFMTLFHAIFQSLCS